jgi:hypothetical protein
VLIYDSASRDGRWRYKKPLKMNAWSEAGRWQSQGIGHRSF